jgi:hypothetical protein
VTSCAGRGTEIADVVAGAARVTAVVTIPPAEPRHDAPTLDGALAPDMLGWRTHWSGIDGIVADVLNALGCRHARAAPGS